MKKGDFMENSIKRDSMVFYDSFFEAIADLPAEEFKKCACAIFGYGLRGEEPESTGIEKTIFILVKPQIDKNNQRWLCAKKSHGAGEEKNSKVKSSKYAQKRSQKTQEETALQATGDNAPPDDSDEVKEYDADFISLCENIPQANDEFFDAVDDCETYGNSPMTDADSFIEVAEKQGSDYDACGEYENVYLTSKERTKLICELTLDGYDKSVDFLSRYIKRKPEYKSACHYEDLRGWVKDALAERNKKEPQKNNSAFDFELDDIFEKP